MRDLAVQGILTKYPMVLQVDPGSLGWSLEIFQQQRDLLLQDLLESRLDASLVKLLRQAEFRRLYFAELPVELEMVVAGEAVTVLRKIKQRSNRALVLGDVAYLKLANNVKREHGDQLLQLVAEALENAGFSIIARFREGDEVVCLMRDIKAVHAACSFVNQYLIESGFSIGGLPPRVDFGVVTHTEVCNLLISLLKQGWKIPVGSTLKREFFEIALKMAESRQGVIKIYERGLLLLELLRVAYGPLWQGKVGTHWKERQIYKAHLDGLTRGAKFVIPNVLWLRLGKEPVESLLMRRTLELLGQSAGDDLVSQMVYRKAVAIYR
jgi:GGDEF domain-containing protein